MASSIEIYIGTLQWSSIFNYMRSTLSEYHTLHDLLYMSMVKSYVWIVVSIQGNYRGETALESLLAVALGSKELQGKHSFSYRFGATWGRLFLILSMRLHLGQASCERKKVDWGANASSGLSRKSRQLARQATKPWNQPPSTSLLPYTLCSAGLFSHTPFFFVQSQVSLSV